jgi:hypothetical protein
MCIFLFCCFCTRLCIVLSEVPSSLAGGRDITMQYIIVLYLLLGANTEAYGKIFRSLFLLHTLSEILLLHMNIFYCFQTVFTNGHVANVKVR